MSKNKQTPHQNEKPGTDSWYKQENQYLLQINKLQKERIQQLEKELNIKPKNKFWFNASAN